MAGRPKGSTDRKNNAIKDMILASLDEVGGKAYFVQQATENPSAYMGLIGKILPKEVEMQIRRSIFEEDLIEASANESIEYHSEV